MINEMFFDKEFLNCLKHLTCLKHLAFTEKAFGARGGDRQGKNYGAGLEYADHRRYNTGDDIRYIDWDLYARSGNIYTKLFLEEKDLYINILIDRSKSTDFGNPAKFQYNLKLAASLAYIGLAHLNHVGIGCFSDDLEQFIPPRRGKKQIFTLLEFLSSIKADHATNLNRSFESFCRMTKARGLVIIISDFLDEKGYEKGLKYLLFRGFKVHIIQVLSKEELTPDISGRVVLHSLEESCYTAVDANRHTIQKYQQELDKYNHRLEKFCNENRIVYVHAVTTDPLKLLLSRYF